MTKWKKRLAELDAKSAAASQRKDEFSRHEEAFHSMGVKTIRSTPPAHRLDKYRVGYSLAGWSPLKCGHEFSSPEVILNHLLLKLHVDQIDALDVAVARIDEEVNANVEPFRAAIELLKTIPGAGDLGAETIVAEIAIDMNRFPTTVPLVS